MARLRRAIKNLVRFATNNTKIQNGVAILYSCRQVYEDIKPKKRMATLRAAILFLGFAFVLTQSTAAIFWYYRFQSRRKVNQSLSLASWE
jgi:hypothetical protein